MMLRVLPHLALAVTEEQVRKRKRVVMLVPGLVAFVVYRVAKVVLPLSEPLVLLGLSGLLSAATAVWAYRIGRDAAWTTAWKEDGLRLMLWLTGWVGVTWGILLSLMVLALLKIFLQYDFLQHPDGPAMMALIIACTSVARDAFEIGHVRRLQRKGDPVLTFPDGAALRALFREEPAQLAWWTVVAAGVGAILSLGLAEAGESGRSELAQLMAVSFVAGSVALWAYLAGDQRLRRELPGRGHGLWSASVARLRALGWGQVFGFWWWPGVAFAATYYLILAGGASYVLHLDLRQGIVQGLIAAGVAGIMALDSYYLGCRRALDDQIRRTVPESILRCPFVLGILSKSRSSGTAGEGNAFGSPAADMLRPGRAAEEQESMGYK